MGLLTLWVPSNQIRLAEEGSSGSTLLPETVTVKDCFSFTDFIDRTLGETLTLRVEPRPASTLHLYVELGAPTLVTVLLKVTVKELSDLDNLADMEG